MKKKKKRNPVMACSEGSTLGERAPWNPRKLKQKLLLLRSSFKHQCQHFPFLKALPLFTDCEDWGGTAPMPTQS